MEALWTPHLPGTGSVGTMGWHLTRFQAHHVVGKVWGMASWQLARVDQPEAQLADCNALAGGQLCIGLQHSAITLGQAQRRLWVGHWRM